MLKKPVRSDDIDYIIWVELRNFKENVGVVKLF